MAIRATTVQANTRGKKIIYVCKNQISLCYVFSAFYARGKATHGESLLLKKGVMAGCWSKSLQAGSDDGGHTALREKHLKSPNSSEKSLNAGQFCVKACVVSEVSPFPASEKQHLPMT